MKCKTCGNYLVLPRDLPNVKGGNLQCMDCWHKEDHDYF